MSKRILIAFILASFTSHVFAAAFQISPVRVHLDADHRIASLMLTNRAKEPVDVQLQVKSW